MMTPKSLRCVGLLATLNLSDFGFSSGPTSAQAQNFAMGQSGQYSPMTVGIEGSGDRITSWSPGQEHNIIAGNLSFTGPDSPPELLFQ